MQGCFPNNMIWTGLNWTGLGKYGIAEWRQVERGLEVV